MALNPATYSTRSLSLLMIAAFAGVALWLFGPSAFSGGSGQALGNNGGAGGGLPASLKVDGAVQTESQNDIVTRLVVPLAVRGSQGIALNDISGKLSAQTALSETAAAAVPAAYSIAWLDGNGDRVLDPGEHAELTVTLPAVSSIHPNNTLDLVIKPADGSTLVIEDVLGQ